MNNISIRGELFQEGLFFETGLEGSFWYERHLDFDACILENFLDDVPEYYFFHRSLLKYNIQTKKYIYGGELSFSWDNPGFQEFVFQSSRGSKAGGNHDPIIIVGNENFTAENGVTGGSGTENDPFIIENWVIVGNGSVKTGIFISNTTAAFVIRNCTISNFSGEDYIAIHLYNVTAGRIENVETFKNYDGIAIRQSSFINVENCVCHDNYGVFATGIYVFRSHHIIINDCEVYRMRCSMTQIAACGIRLWGASYCIIKNSSCYLNSGFGIELGLWEMEFPVQYNVIENCTIYKNSLGGIELFMIYLYWYEIKDDVNRGYNRISDCVVYDNGHVPIPGMSTAGSGIYLWNIDDTVVEDCVIYENGVGMTILDSCNNLVSNCTLYGHWMPAYYGEGIDIFDSWTKVIKNNTIEHCDIFDQGVGIQCSGGYQTIIRSNNIYNHALYGLELSKWFGIAATGVVQGNNIYNNSEGNRFDRLTFFDARDNWWGSPLGPSRFLGLRGDVIWIRLGFAVCLRFPWATKPFVDAGVMS
ncbi:MAG: right-handed parallel beta-helix repeat-containing protein [Candidatus Thermoplasmatota archaeon]|nr:right-handed parallel beta-helix repeat-containing protein [Candidatus Thermoplasmatota archaeon]